MKSFDWLKFVQQYNIPYRDEGPNCAQGNIVIKCPFCGSDDPSEHMGLNLSTGSWGCWRDSSHRGLHPAKLIKQAIGCSWQQAMQISGTKSRAPLDTFDAAIESLKSGNSAGGDVVENVSSDAQIILPSNFEVITSELITHRNYWNYLKSRGYGERDLSRLIAKYSLYACKSGFWRQRVILPVQDQRGQLLTWTGRSIRRDEHLRYMSLTDKEPDPEGNQAKANIKNTIYNLQNLTGGKALYIVEGPLDALKVDFYGAPHQISATCLFGLTVSEAQKYLLREVIQKYQRVFVLMDSTATAQALKIGRELSDMIDEVKFLPDYVDDPGDLTKEQIEGLLLI